VFVNYTRSPEAHYPVAIQAYNATKWVAEYGNEIGVDGKRLQCVLEETHVVAMMAKEKKGPTIKLQVLFWPVTDANFETESYNLFARIDS
jgi:acetyl esterase/lipase